MILSILLLECPGVVASAANNSSNVNVLFSANRTISTLLTCLPRQSDQPNRPRINQQRIHAPNFLLNKLHSRFQLAFVRHVHLERVDFFGTQRLALAFHRVQLGLREGG